MTILILGASSVIGSAIAEAFAPGNSLLLVGRNHQRLEDAELRCRRRGAAVTRTLVCDLTAAVANVAQVALESNVSVVINALSVTSRLRDDRIAPERLGEYFAAEVAAPLDLVRRLAAGTPAGMTVLYVSSILATVQSPNRLIYGSFKAIHEKAISALASTMPGLSSQIVRIATVVDPDRPTRKSQSIGAAVRQAFESRRPVTTYGWSGRLAAGVYAASPALMSAVIRGSRALRRVGPRGRFLSEGLTSGPEKGDF